MGRAAMPASSPPQQNELEMECIFLLIIAYPAMRFFLIPVSGLVMAALVSLFRLDNLIRDTWIDRYMDWTMKHSE
jgi:hypothetical protein